MPCTSTCRGGTRQVVVEVPIVAITEFQELDRTPEVDQEVGLGHDKGKGMKIAPESALGWELQKCDSCERQGVEYV